MTTANYKPGSGRKLKTIVPVLVLATFSLAGEAAVQTKAIKYKDGDATMTGHLYWDDAIDGKRPGVMVVNELWGLNDYAKKRAHMLAEPNYVAFAADMFGDGHVTDKPDQARTWTQEAT